MTTHTETHVPPSGMTTATDLAIAAGHGHQVTQHNGLLTMPLADALSDS